MQLRDLSRKERWKIPNRNMVDGSNDLNQKFAGHGKDEKNNASKKIGFEEDGVGRHNSSLVDHITKKA